MVGLVILHGKQAGKDEFEIIPECKSQDFPEKFKKLDKFFTDLCTDFGKSNTFTAYNVQKVMDIYMLCTE